MSHKTILVVDDIPLMRTMLKKFINTIGNRMFGEDTPESKINIIEAANGMEALKSLSEHQIDLVFLDLMMPEMDGISFMEKKNQDKDMQSIPVVITTAISEEGTFQRAKDLGAKAYIRKPFTIKAVEDHIRDIFTN